MNHIILKGRFVRDPELTFTPSGVAVYQNVIAVKEFGKDESMFVTIKCFQKYAETVADHSFKGQQVIIAGRLSIRSYEKDGQKRYITEVIATQIDFIDYKPKDEYKPVFAAKNPFEKIQTPIDLAADELPF